ncbi:DUF6417 family protein [Streptomyces avermitilis]|uniref:DUF6417 family protein n=1 Tax=Streptomyces avermitilis TaxID=33903 RepID=UPI00340C5791
MAYGFWLRRMTGSATEANRFGREYGVVHRPAHGDAVGPSSAFVKSRWRTARG